MEPQRRHWETPELIVLVRGNAEEGPFSADASYRE
jgi:hypothetical protein